MPIGAGRGDLVTKTGHIYSFIQLAGDPAHALQLFSEFGAMGGFALPRTEPEAVYRKSLSQRDKWELWTVNQGPPGDLPSTSFTEKMPRATATFLEELADAERRFTVHTIISETADPTDTTKWESKEVFAGVWLSNVSRDKTESNEAGELEFSADASFTSYKRLFPMTFGEEAASDITKEVVAVAVYPDNYRGDKDIKEIYILQKVDATAPKLVYSKNGGLTWTAVTLTSTFGTDEPTDMKVVGSYLIACSNAGEAYYYARRDAPGTWYKVSSGFVTSKGPNSIYALGVGDIWFAGDGGYIYKLNVPGQAVTVIEAGSLTVQNLSRVHGAGNSILAVGASNAAIISHNRGISFAALTGPEVGVALNSGAVLDKDHLWIGGAVLSYSLDGGLTWAQSATGIPGLTKVTDIIFCQDQPACGFVAGIGSGPLGGIMRTTDHGANWEGYTLTGLVTNEAINKLAVGGPNYLVAGGLRTAAGADGVAALATN